MYRDSSDITCSLALAFPLSQLSIHLISSSMSRAWYGSCIEAKVIAAFKYALKSLLNFAISGCSMTI